MPHIILEYSANLEPDADIGAIVAELHDGLAAEGIDKARIKTRAHSVRYFNVGEAGAAGKMLHATLLLLEGRDTATKKQYGDKLHGLMKAALKNTHPECAVTLEIRDMDKETYYLG